MDRDLLRQSLTYHGESLLSLLTCEQSENPDFIAIASDLSKAVCERKVPDASSSTTVEQFISRKADLLFAPLWKSAVPVEDDLQEASCEPYAIMPPLEQFMEVSFEERRDLFFRDVERGDVIIGRINSIRDFGFFVTLICTYGDIERDIEDLELTALCPIRDVPSNGNHDDPLSYYQVGDLIRAGLKDVDRYHGKLTVSLHPTSLAPRLSNLKLGVISREDLPIHYCRGDRVASDSTETYERVLESSLGFSNPSNVDVLLGKLGVSETKCCSMMRGLQSKHFQEEDFAAAIRKKQSASWALKCVKAGVDHFKSGRHVEAMNEYNKALEIDTNNVEALVARGALYATKGSLVKAISDFEVSLESCPTHRNAKKYLCQTLVERGGQLEEEEKLVTAEGLYRKALTLDEHFQDATEALQKLQMRIQKSLKLKEEEAAAKELEKTKNVETSAEKLRKILKEEKRMKRKRKRSSSSSSTSSSSSSSSSTSSSASSSDRRKSKKKKQKHRRSSHGDKKRHRRTSSSRRSHLSDEERQEKEVDEEEDWYPEPANTSASFFNLKPPASGLFDPALSFGSSSTADALDDSRGRFEDDPFECGSTKSAKTMEPHSDRRSRSKDRDVNGREKGPSGSHSRKPETGPSGRRDSSRSGPEGPGPRRLSSSSTSSEYSRKSDQQGGSHKCANVSSRHSEHSEKEEKRDARRSEGSAKDSRQPKDLSQNGRRSSEGGPKKELPSNLQDIFNRIAKFEKEKGLKPKK